MSARRPPLTSATQHGDTEVRKHSRLLNQNSEEDIAAGYNSHENIGIDTTRTAGAEQTKSPKSRSPINHKKSKGRNELGVIPLLDAHQHQKE